MDSLVLAAIGFFSLLFFGAIVKSILIREKPKATISRIVSVLIGFGTVSMCLVFPLSGIGENPHIDAAVFFVISACMTTSITLALCIFAASVFLGRAWCSYGCWFSAFFDILPWDRKRLSKSARVGFMRFISLGIALLVSVFSRFVVWEGGISEIPDAMMATRLGADYQGVWFVADLAVVLIAGFSIAFFFRDNRAFCKYLCPVAPVLHGLSKIAPVKISVDTQLCDTCPGESPRCESVCPMDIKLLEYAAEGRRIESGECIRCSRCIDACPRRAVSFTGGIEKPLPESEKIRR